MTTQQRLHSLSDALTLVVNPGSKTVEELLHSLTPQELKDFDEVLDDNLTELFSLIVTDNGSIIPNAAKNLKGDNTPVVRTKATDSIAIVVEGISIFIKQGEYQMSQADIPVKPTSFFSRIANWFKNL